MTTKYRYEHHARRRHPLAITVMTVVVCIVIGLVALFISKDITNNQAVNITGSPRVVGQVSASDDKNKDVQESFFSFQLPEDWKEKERINSSNEKSITWQATKKNFDNRWLKLYIDTIPADYAVNRMVPVTAAVDRMTVGDISDNCTTFTGVGEGVKLPQERKSPILARWSGVNFICNTANSIDNQVGISSSEGINQVTLTGTKGAHKYFFVYIDRNIQPDYRIFTTALQSFRAF